MEPISIHDFRRCRGGKSSRYKAASAGRGQRGSSLRGLGSQFEWTGAQTWLQRGNEKSFRVGELLEGKGAEIQMASLCRNNTGKEANVY